MNIKLIKGLTPREVYGLKLQNIEEHGGAYHFSLIGNRSFDLKGNGYFSYKPLNPTEIKARDGIIVFSGGGGGLAVVWQDIYHVLNARVNHRFINDSPNEDYNLFNIRIAEELACSKLTY